MPPATLAIPYFGIFAFLSFTLYFLIVFPFATIFPPSGLLMQMESLWCCDLPQNLPHRSVSPCLCRGRSVSFCMPLCLYATIFLFLCPLIVNRLRIWGSDVRLFTLHSISMVSQVNVAKTQIVGSSGAILISYFSVLPLVNIFSAEYLQLSLSLAILVLFSACQPNYCKARDALLDLFFLLVNLSPRCPVIDSQHVPHLLSVGVWIFHTGYRTGHFLLSFSFHHFSVTFSTPFQEAFATKRDTVIPSISLVVSVFLCTRSPPSESLSC